MRPIPQLLARLLAPPLFVGACVGWTAGLLRVQATASTPALLVSTCCAFVALASLFTWARLRAVPTR